MEPNAFPHVLIPPFLHLTHPQASARPVTTVRLAAHRLLVPPASPASFFTMLPAIQHVRLALIQLDLSVVPAQATAPLVKTTLFALPASHP